MPILTPRGMRYLPAKKTFDIYAKTGSLQKTVDALVKLGHVHPKTGEPPSRPGVQTSALKFMVYNPDYAREVLLQEDPDTYKWATSEESFCRTMLRMVRERKLIAPRLYKDLIAEEPYKQYATQDDIAYSNLRKMSDAQHVYS